MNKIIIKEQKEINLFIKILNNINQVMKNSIDNSEYWFNGIEQKVIRGSHDFCIGYYKFNLIECINNKNLFEGIDCKINGDLLYKFIKNNKKEINKIIIDENITIKSTNEDIKFSTDYLNNKDHIRIKKINKILNEEKKDKFNKNNKKLYKYDIIELNPTDIEKINKSITPIEYISKEKKYKLQLCGRHLFNVPKNENAKIEIVSISNVICFARILIENKKFKSLNLFYFINYK